MDALVAVRVYDAWLKNLMNDYDTSVAVMR